MSRNEISFVDLCLRGEALAEDIDDFVDVWHEGGTGVPLHVFLGFTRDEYSLWVEQPNSLEVILYARKFGKELGQVGAFDRTDRLAARSLSEDDRDELITWLKQTGRITS